MTAEEYAAQQAAINAAVVAIMTRILAVFQTPSLSIQDWYNVLDLIFPYVDNARTQSAELGREFFDSQRSRHLPGEPRHDTYLAEYSIIDFRRAMEPIRIKLSRPGASQQVISEFGLKALREVESGGRRTILRGVVGDGQAKAWARVATGRETCEFCLTMISRGPVYQSAETAGLDLDDTSASDLWQRAQGVGEDAQLASEELDHMMNKWHDGCDCKVVPVFDYRNWPGRDEYKRAEDMWNKYTRLVNDNPDLLKPKNGNQHASGSRTWTKNEAIFAAIRRDLESGVLDMSDFAVAA